MNKKLSITDKLVSYISGGRFFKLVIVLFIIQALWVALFSKYPMAFDEGYHFGVIKLYANHPNPFWTAQPDGANIFGAIFRDPSYLYHYILSFPYKLISLITTSEVAQIIALRILNISMFVWALFIYKKLLGVMGASRGLTNILIFIFTLIPVTSLLAGQINYDNLLIPVTGLLMLWTVLFIKDLKNTNVINPGLLLEIIAIGLFGSLVKYAFLPFFLASCLVILGALVISYKRRYKTILTDIKTETTKISKIKKCVLFITIILLSVLAVERYGLNYVRYGSLVPDCAQAMSIKNCSEFGPWIRDYNLAKRPAATNVPGPASYFLHDWLYGMWFRLFFALAGPTNNYQTKGPLTLPAWTFISLCVLGLIAVIGFGYRVLKRNTYKVAIPVCLSLFYVLILFANNYGSFAKTGKPVAINGRYLLPVLLPLMAFAGISLVYLLRLKQLKLMLAVVALIGMLAGGGVLTYILRSESSWYWTNPLVTNGKNIVEDAFGPVTPGYKNTSQYLR